MTGAQIGRDCVLGQNVYVAGSVRIGDGVKIQNQVSLYDGVTLADHVFVGPSAVFTNIKNPRAAIPRNDTAHRAPTMVKTGATIGANATILCGVTLGRYAFVGAGAVVTKNVPDFALVLGNPALQAGWRCVCGEALHLTDDQARCPSCPRIYRRLSSAREDFLEQVL